MNRLFTVDRGGIPGSQPDLGSAYSDGFEPTPHPRYATRWIMVVWSVAAWCIGSFVLLNAAAGELAVAWAHLKHWMI
jgi:hypothetical protein